MDVGKTLIACVIAMVFGFLLTYPTRFLAPILGFMDIPKDERRMHKKPTPRIGGVSVYLAFLISMCLTGLFSLLVPYAVCGLIIVTVGIVDDKFSIGPLAKIFGQTLAGIALCLFGITVDTLWFFGLTIDLGLLTYPFTVVWVVLISNIFNLIDGLDGLCCGVSILSAASLALMAFREGQETVTASALVFIFACLGFLPHNTRPAKIFMGDTGAMLCGFVLAALSCQSVYSENYTMPALVPIVIFGIPIFDAVFAIIRRLGSGKSVFVGDKLHVHHRLNNRYGHVRAVILIYMGTLVLAGIAMIMRYSIVGEIVACGLFLLAIAYGVVRFGIYKE